MEILSLADAENRLPELIDAACARGQRFEIATDGAGSAVLLGSRDFESLRETIALLSDQALLAAHECGVAEIAAGEGLDAAALMGAMGDAGRAVDGGSDPTVAGAGRLIVARSAASFLIGTARVADAVALVSILTGPLVAHPDAFGTPVRALIPLPGYTFTRGAYRVVFDIDEVRNSIEVTAIGQRVNAYADYLQV
jgi:prevent-host-death family protein